jgi:hypothetical protein
MDRLCELLWDDDPPNQARQSVRTYVARIRAVLNLAGASQDGVTAGLDLSRNRAFLPELPGSDGGAPHGAYAVVAGDVEVDVGDIDGDGLPAWTRPRAIFGDDHDDAGVGGAPLDPDAAGWWLGWRPGRGRRGLLSRAPGSS